METFRTVQKLVNEQVTDILKVRVSFLHNFLYRIKFRTLATMYEKCRKLILYKCIPLYSTVTLHLLSAKQCDIIQLPGVMVVNGRVKSCFSCWQFSMYRVPPAFSDYLSFSRTLLSFVAHSSASLHYRKVHGPQVVLHQGAVG